MTDKRTNEAKVYGMSAMGKMWMCGSAESVLSALFKTRLQSVQSSTAAVSSHF